MMMVDQGPAPPSSRRWEIKKNKDAGENLH